MKTYHTIQPWRNLRPHPVVDQAPLFIKRCLWADDRELSARDRERLYEFVGETEFKRWRERLDNNIEIQKVSCNGNMIHFDRSVIHRFLFYRVHAPPDGSGWRHFGKQMNRLYE
jgi:hypothetical protein